MKDWQADVGDIDLVPDPTRLKDVESEGHTLFTILGNGVVRTLSVPQMELTEIRIVNLKGKILKQISPANPILYTSDLPAEGIYLAQFISTAKSVEKKFIK